MSTTARLLLPAAALLAAAAPAFAAFPQGVAAGETNTNSTRLWARTDTAGPVTFNVFSDAARTNLVATVPAVVADPNVPAQVDIVGLNPATPYFYSVTDTTAATFDGQFRTFATAGSTPSVRFGVSGDWRGELGSTYPAVRNASTRNLDFFIALGDTVYADDASPASAGFANPNQAQSLSEYRAKHQEVYGGAPGNFLGDLRRSTTIFATIDDHEVTNDFFGGADVSADARFNADPAGTRINDSTLYNNGLQSFQEYNPIRPSFYPNTGVDPRTDGEIELYRSQTIGDTAFFAMLDARSFRDQNVNVLNPLEAANVFNPTRTMLGSPQLAELQNDLLTAQQNGVQWKFVMIPEPAQQLGANNAGDRFEGFYAERNALLQFIAANGIQNVVFVSADIHGTVVNDLYYSSNGLPNGTRIHSGAWEISTGSVAYARPFGQTVEGIARDLGLWGTIEAQGAALAYGVISAQQFAAIQALPPADRNLATYNAVQAAPEFLRNNLLQVLLDQQLATDPLYGPLDPTGLNPSVIPFTVQAGNFPGTPNNEAFFQTFTFGWTEFFIDQLTGNLVVTTWGIDDYTEAEFLADPAGVNARVPTIVSQFTVSPVPEPATVAALLGAAALALAFWRRRRS